MTAAGSDGRTHRDEAVLEARAAELARAPDEGTEERSIDVIPFSVGGQSYAVPAAGVREVRRLEAIARIPLAPASLVGVTRVRSTIVPVFDLPALLGLDQGGVTAGSEWVLVLGGSDEPPLGVAAESVDGIQAQAVGDIVQTGAGETPAALGVTVDGVIVLDSDALLNRPAVFEAPATTQVWQGVEPTSDRDEPQRGMR